MNVLDAGNAFPKLTVAELQGGMLTLGTPRGEFDWQLVVVYRGLHCPICKTYLKTLDGLVADFNEAGVDVNADGNIQILDISNAPFARPDLEGLLKGIKFVRDNDYPIRGTHAGA